MTYYGAPEIARGFRTVRRNTLQIAEEIPEEKYGFSPAPGTRTVAQILVHVAVMPRLQRRFHEELRLSTLVGFDFFAYVGGLLGEEQRQRSKSEILTFLRDEGEAYAAWLDGLTEDFLAERVEYPPGMEPSSKSRFEMVISPKEHEMHHRGQLMLIERMLGIVPHLTRHMMERVGQG